MSDPNVPPGPPQNSPPPPPPLPQYAPPQGYPPYAPGQGPPLDYGYPMPPRRSNLGWIIGIVALVGLLVIGACALSIFLPALNAAKERANRVKCASNLRQIGQGLLLYSNDNKGSYPRTRYDHKGKLSWFTGASDTHPFQGTAVQNNDVTAALFLLVRNTDIDPVVFICPGTNHDKDPSAKPGTQQRSNFSGPNNLSYSYTNPYPKDDPADAKAPVSIGYKISGSVNGSFAIAADRNDGQLRGNKSINSSSPSSDQRKLNSRNHEGDGQNVLFNDGHVEWTTTAFIGHNKDMIYAEAVTIGDPPAQKNPAEFRETGYDPQTDLDTILMPRKGEGF